MAGILTVDALQLGNSGSSANNLVFKTNVDGSFVIARGNNGSALTPILNIDANGKVTSAFDTAPAQLNSSINGYSKLPNGLILQWGRFTSSSTADVIVNFNIEFPNECISLNAFSYYTPGTGTGAVCSQSAGVTVANPKGAFAVRSSLSAIGSGYIAIGY